jgi:hypothetical protein
VDDIGTDLKKRKHMKVIMAKNKEVVLEKELEFAADGDTGKRLLDANVSNGGDVVTTTTSDGDMGKSLLGADISNGESSVMTVLNPLYDSTDVTAGPGDQACRGE